MAEPIVLFSDLPLDVTIASDGDLSLSINKAAISQSLNMLINTAAGSRIFLEEYGCRIRAFLFEPFDQTTANRIGQEIRQTIQNYENRITLLDINVIMKDDEKTYEVEVTYQIINRNEEETLTVSLEKL